MQTETSTDSPAAHAVREVNSSLRPEWGRVPTGVRASGLSRSHIYELIKTNAIKTTVLKKRGSLRGVRLINMDSLMAYIEASCKPEQKEAA